MDTFFQQRAKQEQAFAVADAETLARANSDAACELRASDWSHPRLQTHPLYQQQERASACDALFAPGWRAAAHERFPGGSQPCSRHPAQNGASCPPAGPSDASARAGMGGSCRTAVGPSHSPATAAIAHSRVVRCWVEEKRRPDKRNPGHDFAFRHYTAASFEAMWQHMAALQPAQRHIFEILREGTPCHLYFDLEYERALHPTFDGDSAALLLLDIVCDVTRCALAPQDATNRRCYLLSV